MITAVPWATTFLRIICMKLIYYIARKMAQLEHPCKENNQHLPQGSRKLLCHSGQGGPCRLNLLLLIKQVQACQIILLRLNPTPECIHKCYKRIAYEHMLHRTQKASCLLNPFLTSGKKKSVYTWTENWEITKMKIGCHARNHQLCFLFSLRAIGWFFGTAVSVGKYAALSRVLRFTPSYVTVSKCLLRKCRFPLFKHRVFIIVDSEDCRSSLQVIICHPPPNTSPTHDSRFRWSQVVKGTFLLCVLGEILAQRGAWSHYRCAWAQRFRNVPWHLEGILLLLVQDDCPAKQFMFFFLAYLLADTHRSWAGKLSEPQAPQIFDPTLLAVGLTTLEVWRALAGRL